MLAMSSGRSLTWFICCVSWVIAYVFLVHLTLTMRRAIFHPWVIGIYWAWELLHATGKYGTSTFSSNWLRAFSVMWAVLDFITVVVLLQYGYLWSESIINDYTYLLVGFITMAMCAWLEGPPTQHSKYLSIPVTGYCMLQLIVDVMRFPPGDPISVIYVPVAWFIALGNITGALATWHKMPWGVVGKICWIIVCLLSVQYVLSVHLCRAGQQRFEGLLASIWSLSLSFKQLASFAPTRFPVLFLALLFGVWCLKHKLCTHLLSRLYRWSSWDDLATLPKVDGSSWIENPFKFLIRHAKTFGLHPYTFSKNGTPFLVLQHPATIRRVFCDLGKSIDRYPREELREMRGPLSLEFLIGDVHSKHKRAVIRSMGMHAPKDNLVRLYHLCCRYVPKLDSCDAVKCKEVVRSFALEAVSLVVLGDFLVDDELSYYTSLFRAHFNALKLLKVKRKCKDSDPTIQCGLNARQTLETLLMDKVKQSRDITGKSTLCRLIKEEEICDISDEAVVVHLFMLWAAGFEPVRITLAWILAFMGAHNEVYDKVRREVNSLKNTFQDTSNDEIYKTLRSMIYTQNVYKETLRLKPPAGYITFGINPNNPPYRIHDEMLKKTLTVDHTWRLMIPLGGVNDKLYEKAEEFNPERFTESSDQFWMPFGGGIRQCPALHLVKYEVLLFIFTFFSLYDRPKITATTEATLDMPNESPKELHIKLGDRVLC